MTQHETFMHFPCHFPLKIIGKHSTTFQQDMLSLVQKHFTDVDERHIVVQNSQHGNYLSITVTLYVHDQPSLDALYLELTQHPDTKMVL